jgi:hypothetical protein
MSLTVISATVTSTPTMIRQTEVRNKKGKIKVIFRDE